MVISSHTGLAGVDYFGGKETQCSVAEWGEEALIYER